MDVDVDLRRRALLRGLALTPTSAALAPMLWGSAPAYAATSGGLPDMAPDVHFLRRTSFGIRPADLDAVRGSGVPAYLETQLVADAGADNANLLAQENFPIAHLPASAYWRLVFPNPRAPASGDFAGHWSTIAAQVVGNALYRALFSQRQLYEVMVQFWSSHLNTYDPTFKGPEQQAVIRAHALGNFRAMVESSQRDTTMSRYLNNGDSKKPTPNQNYARELLELHTLGEGRGYGQSDVLALSAILSGHSWQQDRTSADFGQYLYRPEWHVDGPKTFLGAGIAATGQTEINQALDLIFARPECAEFIAFKLCRHFVADVPERPADIQPGDLVWRAAAVFRGANYQIKPLLRFILLSPEFSGAADRKFARPLESGLGLLRSFDVQATEATPDSFNRALQQLYDNGPRSVRVQPLNKTVNVLPNKTLPAQDGAIQHMVDYLRNAGHLPGLWPTPDGFPDRGSFWASATQFITRWNFIAQECERNDQKLGIGGSRSFAIAPTTATVARELVRGMAERLLHRPLRADHLEIVATYVGSGSPGRLLTAAQVKTKASAVATILLASPYAQLL